jgi:transmembrane sensor
MSRDMKSILNSPIYSQAAEWLIELREGEVDVRTCEELDSWFRESPQHIRAYLELSAVWEDGANSELDRSYSTEELVAIARGASAVVSLDGKPLAENRPHDSADPSAGVVLPRALSSAAAELPPVQTTSSGALKQPWRPAWVAAILVACLVVGGRYAYNQRNITYTTAVGEQRFVRLTDGSTLELNSRSGVRIHFSDSQRDVDLIEGQALFHVAKDPMRPFIVHSDTTEVRAVGTQFDVYRMHSGTVVTVVEGRVAVLSPLLKSGLSQNRMVTQGPLTPLSNKTNVPPTPKRNGAFGAGADSKDVRQTGALLPDPSVLASSTDAIFLDGGEQVIVSSQGPVSPTRANTAVAIAWTQHQLVFDATPLSEVAREFNRYNTRQLSIADPALRGIRITGVFSSVDSTSLVKFLRAQPDIDVRETNEGILIVKR